MGSKREGIDLVRVKSLMMIMASLISRQIGRSKVFPPMNLREKDSTDRHRLKVVLPKLDRVQITYPKPLNKILGEIH